MSTTTINYTGELVVLSCWCGIKHAVPKSLRDHQLRQHDDGKVMSVYCPLGHEHVPAGETRAAKLERELVWERDRSARMAAARAQAEASASAYKGVATKARKRAASALCPCCNRSFVQLRRHMESKHPDYDPAVPA